jgi:alkanesulfonate monooxygenase SsuD/methylene tetrahydromethanopterin reductase-like flavin-dependent oxidoreductase (luciferase family)
LGVGAGWQAREHEIFGFELLDLPARFERYEEGLQVILRLLRSDTPVTFEGNYYCLKDASLLPRPNRPGGPPLLVGGNGVKRVLPLAARYAYEWNAVYLPPDEFARLNARLDNLLAEAGRQPYEVRRSMMTGCVFGRDQAEVRRKVSVRTQGKRDAGQLRRHGALVGTAQEFVDQLGRLEEAGVQCVMLQWLDLDDLDGLEAMAAGVLPQLS